MENPDAHEGRGATPSRLMAPPVCELQFSAGRTGWCPEDDACPFWHDEACVLEPVYRHLERNRELAAGLLRVRGALTASRPAPFVAPPPGLR